MSVWRCPAPSRRNLLDQGHQLQSLNFGNWPTADFREDVGLEPPQGVVGMSRISITLPLYEQRPSYRRERVFGGNEADQLCSFSRSHRIHATVLLLARFVSLDPSFSQSHLRVLTQSHQFFFATDGLLPSPELAARGRNKQEKATGVGALARLDFRLGSANGNVCEGHGWWRNEKTSPWFRRYPGRYPEMALDRKRLYWTIWT